MSFLRSFASLSLFYAAALWVLPAAANDFTTRVVPAITDRYILSDATPDTAIDNASIRLVLAPGEYEPASFVVYADSELNDLQITTAPLATPEGEVLADADIDIRVVKRWYQRRFGGHLNRTEVRNRFMVPELLLHDDDLVVIVEGENMLRMSSGEYVSVSDPTNRSGFWTPATNRYPVIDAKTIQPLTIAANDNRQFWVTVHVADDVAAGEYVSVITLQAGDEQLSIPVAVEVLPFQLAKPALNYSIYYRGILDDTWPNGSVSSEIKSEAQMLADLKNMREHGISNPSVYQKIGTGQLGTVLQLRSEAGMTDPELYYLGVNVVANDNGQVSPRLTRDVEKTLELTEPAGITDVYFYARDEARGKKISYQYPFWQAVRQAGGKIMAAGWQTGTKKKGNFDITDGEEDLYVALGALRREEAARWHSKKRLIYSYQNPTGGRELPETWRRNYGLLLWQRDFDGGMPYAWQHAYGNTWNDFDHKRHRDHNFTYPAVDKPIDTVQWEGLREGVDDVRYLTTLNALLAASKKSVIADEASAWIAELKEQPLGPADLAGIRAQMIGYILALQAPPDEESVPAEVTLSVGTIDENGNVEVTVKSDIRQSAQLEVLSEGDRQIIESHALLYEHKIQVSGLDAGKIYQIQAVALADDEQRLVLGNLQLNANNTLQLSGERYFTAGQTEVNVEIATAYSSSLAIDTDRSLLGWWRFTEDESAGDISSWQQKVLLKGDARLGAGKFGSGVVLDGDGSFINMPDIEFAENGVGTIEGWFRFNSFAMDNLVNMGLFSGLYQHGSNNHFYVRRSNDHFEVRGLLRKGSWHHIALTWDGDVNSATVYIDGNAVPSTVQGKIDDMRSFSGLNIGRSAGYIGGMVGSATNTFDGSVDEIKAWNRVLSPAEVAASYEGALGRFSYSEAQLSPAGSIVLRAVNANDAEAVFELKR